MIHLRALLGIAALAVLPDAARADATIYLTAHAKVATREVRLFNVAAVDSADTRLARRLSALVIAAAPRPGAVLELPRERIAQAIERVDSTLAARLDWMGAAAVRVSLRDSNRIAGERLTDAAAAALIDRLGQQHRWLELAPVGRVDDIVVPEGELKLAARLAPDAALAARVNAWVDVRVDGRHYRSVPVWFAAKAYEQALVARQPLAAGETPRRDDFDAERIDVARYGAALDPARATEELRTRVAVAAGRPLLASQVEQRPPVLRNQPVEVRVSLGWIAAQASGIALADGRLGDVVSVRNPAGGSEPFAARVVGAGVVEVSGR